MLRKSPPSVLKGKALRSGRRDFSVPQILALSVALTLLISIPIWTHPLPPLSDYVNHLARMHVIADLSRNQQLAHVLPTELAGDPQSGDGRYRAVARPARECLPRRTDFSGRDVRTHHIGRRDAQSGAGRPIFGSAIAGNPAALQLRLPGRPDELHFRDRRRSMDAGGLGQHQRACLADTFRTIHRVHRRLVFLPSVGARYLRHRPALRGNSAAMAAKVRALAAQNCRFCSERPAISCRGAAALSKAPQCALSPRPPGSSAASSTD